MGSEASSKRLGLLLAIGTVTILVLVYYSSQIGIEAESNGHLFLFKPNSNKPPMNNADVLKNKSYVYAADYYSSIGYAKCERLTDVQTSKQLWMSVKINLPCERYFDDFLAQMLLPPPIWPPPKSAPVDLRGKYYLDGRITRESSYYITERYEGAPIPYNWTVEFVLDYKKKAERKENFHYESDTQQVYNILRDYNLTNLSGIVIGSEVPWVEAILLVHGRVKNILTVEYHPIVSTDPQIEVVLPSEFNRNWRKFAAKKFDFVFTYSSLEHSGLGRYGDRLDPSGDLKDLHKLTCLLPPGGLVFLGIPVGFDKIEWNAHRIYGQWRLPLMSANYEVLGLYDAAKIQNPMKFLQQEGYRHAIIVMKNARETPC